MDNMPRPWTQQAKQEVNPGAAPAN